MKILRSLGEVPEGFGPTVLSIGNFDGVHRAHQRVLSKVVSRAKEINAKSLAVTFDPHPSRILRPESAPKLLTPLTKKIQLLEATGLDALLVLPFDRNLSLTTPREFAREILRKRLDAIEVHEGFNFHFGHKAEGNVEKLSELGYEFGFEVRTYTEMQSRGHAVSSSSIRRLLEAGKVGESRHLLGRIFTISAGPASGRGFGQRFTVPTINLDHYDEMVPANGVYVTLARIGDENFESVTNIGNRPTFGEDSFAIETHLLDFHPFEMFTDTMIELSFLKWLRAEKKWPNVESLRAQIGKDVGTAQRYFHLCRTLGKRAQN